MMVPGEPTTPNTGNPTMNEFIPEQRTVAIGKDLETMSDVEWKAYLVESKRHIIALKQWLSNNGIEMCMHVQFDPHNHLRVLVLDKNHDNLGTFLLPADSEALLTMLRSQETEQPH
jgi:hypothetical protein